MFHGLTMVNFDGQTQNQMMVRPWSTMVDHGRPWSDGQTVAGAFIVQMIIIQLLPERYWTAQFELLKKT